MKKILWSPRSIQDLYRIVNNIAKDKKKAALQWAQTIYKKVSRLQKFPQSGRMVPELGRVELREILLGSYRIIYKIADSQISILTIFHGAKEITGDFFKQNN